MAGLGARFLRPLHMRSDALLILLELTGRKTESRFESLGEVRSAAETHT